MSGIHVNHLICINYVVGNFQLTPAYLHQRLSIVILTYTCRPIAYVSISNVGLLYFFSFLFLLRQYRSFSLTTNKNFPDFSLTSLIPRLHTSLEYVCTSSEPCWPCDSPSHATVSARAVSHADHVTVHHMQQSVHEQWAMLTMWQSITCNSQQRLLLMWTLDCR